MVKALPVALSLHDQTLLIIGSYSRYSSDKYSSKNGNYIYHTS